MRYRRFEELPVWNAAIELAIRIFALAETGCLDRYSGLRNQIERAVVSISNNIAEGFERGTTAELIAFLYIARGSAGEVRSMTCLLQRLSELNPLDLEVSDLNTRATSISRQLGAWIDSMKNSNIPGTRYNNDQKKSANEAAIRKESFLAELERVKNGEPSRRDMDRPWSDDQ